MFQSVVGVTCLGSSHPLLTKRQFDLCIVDEATQVLQPTVLRTLFSAHKFILIGDPNQLPPLVKSFKAKYVIQRDVLNSLKKLLKNYSNVKN